jgi:SSS family solute:Na+ symporter
LLGGIWIIQTLPPVMLGAYTRWFNSWALLAGWAVGRFAGTGWLSPRISRRPFRWHCGHTFPGYTAVYTVILNLVVAAVLTPVFNAMGARALPRTRLRRGLRGLSRPEVS